MPWKADRKKSKFQNLNVKSMSKFKLKNFLIFGLRFDLAFDISVTMKRGFYGADPSF
jgi:hypothetical protein